ncbi:HAMP domain-containing histidine kinase [Priestia megaterium]|uniref:histidine kinase n=1 Tax=Priestia megaterium TaxID=1404 RepID=A0A6H1PBR5_PRIMG|nr:HAMP domain-containing histidine kinase [Priestia megaterium]
MKDFCKLITNPVTSMIQTMKEIRQSGRFKRLTFEGKSKDELFQMGETFNHMIDLLETNYEKHKQFVSNASHEFKTPLTIIESYASLLKRRGLTEPELFSESIEAIHSEAIRMKEMTEQLLLLAKHHEQWNIQIAVLNLAELLPETVNAFRSGYPREIYFQMKNKLIVGALSGLLILGGAVAVGASKKDTRVDDSIHQDDKKIGSKVNKKKVENETEHGQTVIKVKADDTNSGDITTADDGVHQNRHSGDDDNKADDGAHQNRHSGDDDNKADDDNS